MGELGERAERHVEERIRAALPAGATCFANVRWLAPTREGGPARNGEIDLLLVLPAIGILVIETKAGPITRDGFGRWYAGPRHLDESPFQQAETSGHAMTTKIEADPRWRGELRMIHAVAFPDTDRGSLTRDGRTLGPDAPPELILDRADLATDQAAATALARVIGYWSGDGARDRTLTATQVEIICDVIEPEVVLRALLRSDIEEGEHELRAPPACSSQPCARCAPGQGHRSLAGGCRQEPARRREGSAAGG